MRQLPSPRDVLLFETEHGDVWVSAVDSCGGIGEEPHDSLQADPVVVGMFTARVALLEIMAVGAKPAFASLAVSNGPHTAELLLAGARNVLGEAFPCVVSTEKNMQTSMTGFGITVTGFCKKEDLLAKRAKTGDVLYCAGIPLVGAETLETGAKLFGSRDLEILLENPHVHTVIPVGSKGVAAEAEILAAESGLSCTLSRNSGIGLYKSAGPSTCAVFSADACAGFGLVPPVFKIGTLSNP